MTPSQKHYAANRERRCAQARARYAANPEKEKDRYRRYYAATIEERRALQRGRDATAKRKEFKKALEQTPKMKAARIAYRKRNPRKDYHREHERAYRKRRKELHANKQLTDVQYRLRRALRSRLKQAIKKNQKGGSAIALLGCTVAELRLHLERQWLPGMSWWNFGLLRRDAENWQIDHILPLSSFDLTDPRQVAKACHFSNLAPLWAIDNRRKANKTSGRKEVFHGLHPG